MSIEKIRITPVKDAVKVHAIWSLEDGSGSGKRTLDLNDPPRPELQASLNALIPDVLINLCLPPDYSENCPTRVVSVQWRYNDAAVGVRFQVESDTGEADLWSHTTPWLSVQALSDATQERLTVVYLEADHYIKGNRAQQTMPLQTA